MTEGTSDTDIGRATLNLSGREVQTLLVDLDDLIETSEGHEREVRESIREKLEQSVGGSP